MRVALVMLLVAFSGCLAKEGTRTVQKTVDVTVRHVEDDRLPDVAAHAAVWATGENERYLMEAQAWNNSTQSYLVPGVCETPWTEAFRRANGEPFLGREPEYRCLAIGYDAFGPGAHLRFETSWIAQRWESNGQPAELEPGTYTWELTFRATTDEETEWTRFVMPFEVRAE